MGQVLHGSARTTEAVRRAIQHSQESLRALAKRYGVNQKTMAKWRKRSSVCDQRTGPKESRSTVLPVEDEAIIFAFRRHTLLPLDDCLYALQATIPHLIRFPADYFGEAIFGHQWKPARLLMISGWPASDAHRSPMIASSSSIVPTCLLTMGSSTRIHKVSAGCSSGV